MSNHNLYALVTGGNRGIGLEVCKQLVERKKPVILTCRNLEAGKAAAAELSKNGTDVRVLSLDTGSAASISELAQHIKSEYDQNIDLLVSRADLCHVAAVQPSSSYCYSLQQHQHGLHFLQAAQDTLSA
uniref:Ketoreductase (KR) domain-containing protein n=1 Tax=Tetradesmus obliquus TaxID=3088 RepID=A0A383VCV6_TETOB|eukprot:jgi/Sobl393_1/12438/SZX62552.1